MLTDPRAESHLQAELLRLWPLLGRPIAFHRRLVDITGSVKAALLLSQAIYWTRHGREVAQRGGWFHKTADQWVAETGLSPIEQAGARARLRDLGLIAEQRSGAPARLHFRVNLDEIGRLLAHRLDAVAVAHPVIGVERTALIELLGPAAGFHRALVGTVESVNAALLLSRALHLTRMQTRRQHDAWLACPVTRWQEELGLSRREQETARRELVLAGLWEERLAGMPPVLHGRIRLVELLARLAPGQHEDAAPQSLDNDIEVATAPTEEAVSAPDAEVPDGARTACGKPSVWFAPKLESRMRESRSLGLGKAPFLFRGKRRHRFEESANPEITRLTTTVGLQPPQAELAPKAEPQGGGGELIFPAQLLPQERVAARQLLKAAAGYEQALLDELAGRMRTEQVRHPIAYLRALVARAGAGRFIAEMAPRVAADRARREREARQAIDDEQLQRPEAEADAPEREAHERERRERAKAVLQALRDGLRQARRKTLSAHGAIHAPEVSIPNSPTGPSGPSIPVRSSR